MSATANGYAADNGNGDEACDTDEKLILTYRRTLKFYKGLLRECRLANKFM